MVAAEWPGQPYRLCHKILGADTASESHRHINPLGQTPGRRVGGKVIGQSLAILQHLAASSSGPRLGAKSGPAADQFNVMLAFLHTTFFGGFTPLWMAMDGASETDKPIYAALGADRVRVAHEQFELLMGDRDWLVGDQPATSEGGFRGFMSLDDAAKGVVGFVLSRPVRPARIPIRPDGQPSIASHNR